MSMRHSLEEVGIFLAILSGMAHAIEIHVPGDQPTIQAGIDAANAGDVILVAVGIYAGPGNKNLDLHGKSISVRSQGRADATVIDCEGAGRAFFLAGSSTEVVIDGFTMRNGNGNGEEAGGGAVFIGGGAPNVSNCRFEHNRALGRIQSGGGGAIVAYNSEATISDCTFVENEASGFGTSGGALAAYQSSITINHSRFERNVVIGNAATGGGVSVTNITPVFEGRVEGCELVENTADDGSGGGVCIVYRSIIGCEVEANMAEQAGGILAVDSEVQDCSIVGNSAVFGGGLQIDGCVIRDCQIMDNTSIERGGGIDCYGAGLISFCVLARNTAARGGGISGVGEAATVQQCTIVDNVAERGSGIYVASATPRTWIVTNVIVTGGIAGAAMECFGAAELAVSCSDVYANAGGDWAGCIAGQDTINGNRTVDPAFCVDHSDWHLCADSPCAAVKGDPCGLIGALPVACAACAPTGVEASSWGRVKYLGLEEGRARR